MDLTTITTAIKQQRTQFLNSVFDQMSAELSHGANKRNLSRQLIARIVVLSQSFTPYVISSNDKENSLSPERGLMLSVLIRSKLSESTYSNIYYHADFSFADLRNFDLSYAEATLRHANLNRASLVGAKLFYADLREVKLSHADLREVNLYEANLSNANLQGADLRGASLGSAILEKADLSNADLRGTNLRDAVLSGANLTGTKLTGALVHSTAWIEQLKTADIKGMQTLSRYWVKPERQKHYPDVNEIPKGHVGASYLIAVRGKDL